MDTDLLRVTRRQLTQISEQLSRNPTPDSILGMSAPLRQLLIDNGGVLRKAWLEVRGSAGFSMEPQIEANYLDEVVSLPSYQRKDATSFAVAGFANFKGAWLGPIIFTNVALGEQEIKQQLEFMYKNHKTRRKLTLYLRSVSIFYNGLSASREEVIKYAANKLGGVHYDKKRDNSKRAVLQRFLDEAFDFYADHPQGSSLPFYIGPGANGLHLALLSAAHEVVESPNVVKLLEYIDSVVPRQQGFMLT